MASSSSSFPSPQSETCLNFITHVLKAFIDTVIKIFSHDENSEEVEQLPQAIASTSSSGHVKHQVFLSFRGEDTRLNFTAFLLEELKATGMNVFFDEDTLERGELLSPALSQGIAASKLSIIVLSPDYASSKSCLAELSDIMHRKATQGHIVLPIFYHVDPSHVRNLSDSFKKSFANHESKELHQVQRWKTAFSEVGKLKGWHIEGGKFDKPEPDYIKDVVRYVIKKVTSSQSKSDSEEYIGIDDQKQTILRLIEQEDTRTIGLWGTGGIGKTTLANVVYKEVSQEFDDSCFLLNVSQRLENNGWETLRKELLSVILKQTDIRIDTPSIGSFYQERLNNKRVIVVLDDVNDSEQVEWMGVKHFGDGSKIILTSRDRQVLKSGGADKIHEVKKLNEKDSLILFSSFAFKQLNPVIDFQHLSYKFVRYADGSPLALRVLGSQLYQRSETHWKSELDRLKEYPQQKISFILKRSFDKLDNLEKNIFLDIACFFKGKHKIEIQEILCCLYKGAVSGINNLFDKCLLDNIDGNNISMHDMFEEMGKSIVRQESKDPGKRSRLWIPKDVYQVFKNNRGTESIEGIKLDMSKIADLQLCPIVFENMFNLKYIHFDWDGWEYQYNKPHADEVDILCLPDELRYLFWVYYPFKSLSSSFNPKNLVVLKLPRGNMEKLWSEDDGQELDNLRELDVSYCKNLRKIPNLSRAINLENLCCYGCESLVELVCLNHLTSLENISFVQCKKLRKIPNLIGAIKLQSIDCSWCESLVELPCLRHLTSLESLQLHGCRKLKKFPELPNNFSWLDLSNTEIEEVSDSIEHLLRLESLDLSNSKVKNICSNISKLESLRKLNVGSCKSLKSLRDLQPYMWRLNAENCTSLEKISFADHSIYQSDSLHDGDEEENVFMSFSNCRSLNQDSIKSIESNAMLHIRSLTKIWARREQRPRRDWIQQRRSRISRPPICCFPGNEISAIEFEHQSLDFSLNLKIAPNELSGSRFLAFAICLVPDFTQPREFYDLQFNCEYLLTAASGEKLRSCCFFVDKHNFYKGDHIIILSGEDMIIKDNDYEEASFDFKITKPYVEEYIRVKKCGVHVLYVDAESSVEDATSE